MPIYEYRCEACGHALDELQKLSDAPLTECPACGKPALVKQVTAAAFHLKGGGWYKTDFKDGQKKDAPQKDEAAKGDAAKRDAASGDASTAPTATAEIAPRKDDATRPPDAKTTAAGPTPKAVPATPTAPAKPAAKP